MGEFPIVLFIYIGFFFVYNYYYYKYSKIVHAYIVVLACPSGFHNCRNEHIIRQTPHYSEELAILQIWGKMRHVMSS